MIAKIKRLGTIDRDIVEANPVVFHGELYRFEGIRWAGMTNPYHGNKEKKSYCRLIRVRDGAVLPPFGFNLHLGNAFVHEERMIVTAVADHTDIRPYLYQIETTDLVHWSEPRVIFGGPEWRIHNTTLCREDSGKFLLSWECDHPAGLFCMRFAESDDLREYHYLPEALFGPGYTGGPILRSYADWYYIFYITGDYETEFVWNVSRSRDLRNWEPSAHNPIMRPEESDRRLAPGIVFPAETLERMKKARHINVSDMDFCDWQGHLTINYSWGDQKGTEFLALAESDVTEREFCEQYFA